MAACKPSRKSVIYNDLRQIISTQLLLTSDLMGTDGSGFQKRLSEFNYKILHYIDSTGCNECSMKSLHYWRSTLEDTLFRNVGFFFVLWSDNFEETKRLLNNINFRHTVYIDMYGLFGSKHEFLRNKMYHTLLVDKDNTIVLVGDILGNIQLKAKYLEVISNQ
jgi:hypothetical protein